MTDPPVPRPRRGTLPPWDIYGTSVLGAPLRVWSPAPGVFNGLLIVAGMHGEEAETTAALSAALRSVYPEHRRAAVVLGANPDGLAAGTRANAQGVDLNRNFPSSDWDADDTVHRWRRTTRRDVLLHTHSGDGPASEPETTALMALTRRLEVSAVLCVHSPLGCVIDRDLTPFARDLSVRSGLPLVECLSAPTRGTYESWVRETLRVPAAVMEFPCISKDAAMRRFTPLLEQMIRAETHG